MMQLCIQLHLKGFSDTHDGKWWEEEALSDIIYEQLLVHASLHLHKLEDYCGNHKAGSLLKEG
jgi:hypothetical protein